MRSILIIVAFVLMGVFILTACDSTESDVPTLAPTLDSQVEEPTDQPSSDLTTETPTTTRPVGRPTLPATWTPGPTATDLPPEPTNTSEPTVEIINPPEFCANFGPDTSQTDEVIELGNPANVGWRPIEEAVLYRLVVFDNNDAQAHERLVEETTYEIPADVFRAALRYGWEVRPLDNVGIQICPGRGGLINVRP